MKMNLQHSKFTYGAPLTAIAVSAMLLMGSATGANAWHNGYKHQGSGLGKILGGAAAGAIIGGIVKGKKGAAIGAGAGALVGAAASANSRAAPPPPPPVYAAPVPAPVYGQGLVCDIQSSLLRLGYNPGPVDCIFGQMTSDAIGTFQYYSKFAVTGQPSQTLLYQLKQAGG